MLADLATAVVYPQPGDGQGDLVFAGATPGTVLAIAVDQAQERGALLGLTRTFTALRDSDGRPWPSRVSGLRLGAGPTLLQVVEILDRLGLAEASSSAGMLHLRPPRRPDASTVGATR